MLIVAVRFTHVAITLDIKIVSPGTNLSSELANSLAEGRRAADGPRESRIHAASLVKAHS